MVCTTSSKELIDIAWRRGLTRYSRFRKADLIDTIEAALSRDVRFSDPVWAREKNVRDLRYFAKRKDLTRYSHLGRTALVAAITAAPRRVDDEAFLPRSAL